MSTIERLSIQGIRSFGANADDTQVINWLNKCFIISLFVLFDIRQYVSLRRSL